jgi:hypothetical protein
VKASSLEKCEADYVKVREEVVERMLEECLVRIVRHPQFDIVWGNKETLMMDCKDGQKIGNQIHTMRLSYGWNANIETFKLSNILSGENEFLL